LKSYKNDTWWKRGCSKFCFKYRFYSILLKNKANFYTLKNTVVAFYVIVKKFKLIGNKKLVMKKV